MSIEGELVVRVSTAGGRVSRASARAERPRVAGRLFAGRPADEAPALAGALFAICGRSQAIGSRHGRRGGAGRGARAATPGRPRRAHRRRNRAGARLALPRRLAAAGRARSRMSTGSRAGARCWRRCSTPARTRLDVRARDEAIAWARRCDLRPPAGRLPRHRLDRRACSRWIAEAGTPRRVARRATCWGATRRWARATSTCLPYGDDRWVGVALAPAIDQDERLRRRAALARRGPGDRARSRARRGIRWWPTPSAPGGAAWARGSSRGSWTWPRRWRPPAAATARVRLGEASGHRLGGDGARAAGASRARSRASASRGYRIVAPTEWNFHPEGAFARGAMAIPADDAARLESDVRWLVASLDPCVGVRYEAGHA